MQDTIKKIVVLTNLFFFITTASPYGMASNEVCKDEARILRCNSGSIPTIDYLGNVILSGTHVTHFLAVTGGFEGDACEIEAGKVIGNINVTHLKVNHELNSIGIFHTDHSIFSGNTKIIGNLKGSNDKYIGETEIIGNTTFDEEEFHKNLILTGDVNAHASHMIGSLRLNSCSARFSKTVLNQIYVGKQSNCSDNTQKIYLISKSQLNGNLVFEGGNGKVYISKDSVINGQVVGGLVIPE